MGVYLGRDLCHIIGQYSRIIDSVVDMEQTKILIVEDSMPLSSELKRRVEDEIGFDVVQAKTFSEAKKIISMQSQDFFLAVLDLSLPDAPNGEIVDYAKAFDLPSIVFTATLDQETRKRILAKEVIDYVYKADRGIDNLLALIKRLHRNLGVKVLIVDDSKTTRSYLNLLLSRYFLNVFEAKDGKAALKILDEHADIKLAVTDFEMPGMDGVELTKRIRAKFSPEEIAIVGISSNVTEPLSVLFIKSGANDFLNKPFEAEEFFCRVIQNVESVERTHRLRELDKLKNKFLGIAAHDLRSPINGIKGFTQLLLEEEVGSLNEQQNMMLGFIEKASSQMNSLVNDLLDVSVIESGKLELEMTSVELGELLAKQIRTIQVVADRKGIVIRKKLDDSLSVVADGIRIAQVADNLLSNAVKFSPEGSVIEVESFRKGDAAVVCVRDQGPGISEEDQGKLFQSFQRLSAKPTGGEASTGLGLAIVKKIMDGHKGEVWVESTPGEGSSFCFSLNL